METIANYINGELRNPITGNYLDDVNPATAQIFARIPLSKEEDLKTAVDSAEKAFPQWSSITAKQRANYLIKIAELINDNLDELAVAESKDTGKPIQLAKTVDIPRASANLEFFAHAITQFSSESHASQNVINYTLRKPIGVVACISPWNLPLYLFTWKIAPALAAGNCVIAKPSEITPYTAYLFSKICIEAGLPKGVLNILHGAGSEIGDAIVQSKKIKAISFTGGTATGRKIAATSAPMFRKISLELGGKNPALVFADCDLEKTVKELVRASFSNQGEICLCASRIYIEDSLYEAFKTKFVKEVKLLEVGDPSDHSNNMGSLVSKQHLAKVKSYVELAKAEGGVLLCGDEPLELGEEIKNGYFLRPHVFENLTNQCRTNQEEIFGPVVSLNRFRSEEEGLSLANESEYGLASSLWTNDLSKAHRIANQIETGIVWINCWMNRDLRTPFGGMKNSGLGREGGLEALRFFTEPKNICLQY
ncbi:aminomuconate-semialdehyde/2-hydroxymuconate-6-semialdehyde dehydrogenase [Marivirga sericea]|uniref:Aminomuconate-semialdehyde/2-hydroxymuconate-6-semialdehyde dehydrogenase n=1 Tax=Marivirga sericea TaxID=1028 RepID=A0A1X7J8V9_9BACT|nr:aldehyde dehydrogenase [Marivirga sericea]SMG24032.1 aminomuconate-semialdehyde/2-hydroxymuconate-6-semialdehyde dehydrogenase [Marivirga sericea]